MSSKEQSDLETWEEICDMFAEFSRYQEFGRVPENDQESGPNNDNPHTEGCLRRNANGIHYLSITPVWTKESTRRRWIKENEE